jgi:hypothetical protein
MANVNADLQTNAVAIPPVRNKVNRQHGRVRWFEATYTAPATGMPGIGDTITWGALPKGARVIGHLSQLNWSTGTASSTLNVGDAASAARHLAATAITTAGVATPQAQSASGAQFETSDDSSAATNNCTLISTIAGAGLAASQVLTLKVAYVCD